MKDLTIVTSCHDYGHYLSAWTESIVKLTTPPGAVVIVTHGSETDRVAGATAEILLNQRNIITRHHHSTNRLDFGVARNLAVSLAQTAWVMHLDADDRLMPHALIDIAALAPNADVISLGYERAGDRDNRPRNPKRVYKDGNGLEMLTHIAPASGVSPFRKSLWERSPYREDMRGAWDTALWIGFARLGARFRATKRPCFWYWHHTDSVFTKRRTIFDWTHAITVSQLKMLRRNDAGVSIIVPLDQNPDQFRRSAWDTMREHYARRHPSWQIVEGYSRSPRWNKGEAVTDALTHATGDVLVIADSDCFVVPYALDSAVQSVAAGTPWAMPHGMVHRLTMERTPEWCEYIRQRDSLSDDIAPTADQLCRPSYQGYLGGGIIVVRRVHYEAVGGFPTVFSGWGGEDESLGIILNTLIGPAQRGVANLIHLWHPYQPTRSIPSRNTNLCRAIKGAATRGPEELWDLLLSLPNTPRTFAEARQMRNNPGPTRVGVRR